MSFLAGPECATASNPLAQFTKHTQADTSLHRDRIVGHPALDGLQDAFRTQVGSAEQADRVFQEFFSQPTLIPDIQLPDFDMEQLRRDMENLGPQPTPLRQTSNLWAQEMRSSDPLQQQRTYTESMQHLAPSYAATKPHRSDELNSFQSNAPARHSSLSAHRPLADYMPQPIYSSHMLPQQALMNHRFSPRIPTAQARDTQMDKGKGRMVELDDNQWEAEFAQLEQSQAPEATDASAQSETLHDGDFDSLWKGIAAEQQDGTSLTDRQMKVDLTGLNGHEWDDFDMPAFEPNFRTFEQGMEMGNYQLQEENPFTEQPNPFEEGLQILRSHGNLSLAALAFEAAVQRDHSHVEAWLQLGQTQASNEMETQAIRALERTISLQPENAAALMSLSISYTNESYDQLALRTLEKWLSVRYPDVLPAANLTPVADTGFTDPDVLRSKVTGAFIRAAQRAPSGASMDPDVQIGLGVLFYTAGTYSKAIDCFQAALDSTEDSFQTDPAQIHLLWNRLGATLANSARPEEAIAAYERALELNPAFTRARYNLGVSCINMGFLKEAAGHLLGAMAMHQRGVEEGRTRAKELTGRELGQGFAGRTREQSANLMETLQRVFRQMERRDLMEMVTPNMDVERFRGTFDF